MRLGSVRASVAARLAVLLTVALLVSGSADRRPQPGSEDLLERSLFSRYIDAGQVHHYHVRVPAGRALVVTLHQLGESDVTLSALSHRRVVTMDHDTQFWGDERLTLIAPSRDTLFLLRVDEVGDGESPARRPRYSLETSSPVPVRPEDHHRARAEELWAEGHAAEDAALKRDRLARAAAAWEASGDPTDQAQALLELIYLNNRARDPALRGSTETLATQAYQLLRDEAPRRPELVALALYYLGISRSSDHRPDEALETLDRAYRLLLPIPGFETTRRATREELACALAETGRTIEARTHFEDLLDSAEGNAHRTRLHERLGRLHLDAGSYQLARSELRDALELAEREKLVERAAKARLLLAKAYRRDDNDPTGTHAQQALTLLEESLPHLDGTARIDALNERAKALRRLGSPERARTSYQEALRLARRSGNHREEAVVYANLAWLEDDLGYPTRAERYLDQALELFGRSEPRGSGAAATQFRAARLAFDQKRLTEALDSIERAIGLLDDQWIRTTDTVARLELGTSRRAYFELLVDVLMALHQRAPESGWHLRGLLAAEQGRARILFELMREAEVDLSEGAPRDLLEKRGELARHLRRVEGQISVLESASPWGRGIERLALGEVEQQIAELKLRRDDVEIRLSQLEDELRRRGPGFEAVGLGPSLTADDLPALFESLPPRTQILSYFLGAERSHAWLLSRDGLQYEELRGRSEIQDLSATMHHMFSHSNDPLLARQALDSADDLAEMILFPFASRLDGEHLLVIPDGPLFLVPFGALPERAPDTVTLAPLLMDRRQVGQVHSLDILHRLTTTAGGPSGDDDSLAVIADAVFSRYDSRVDRALSLVDPIERPPELLHLDPLDRLEFSGAEGRAIRSLVPADQSFLATGFDATVDVFDRPEVRSAAILHIATHAVADSPHRSPYLELTAVDPSGASLERHRLDLRDIVGLRLEARLAVLSACGTAVGKEVRGEGLFSLSRAFLAAGVPRLVVSLWEVDDRATSELMESFYRRMLEDGLPPGEALRQAQLEARRKGQTPRDWAAWVLIGDPDW